METEIIKPVDGETVVLTPPRSAEMEHPSLSSLEKDGVISKEGRSWFIEATDPFHDTPLTLAGYPDTNVANSVVQCVKQSVAIQCPSTITTGLWDVNIVLWPRVDYSDHTDKWVTTDYNTFAEQTTTTVAPYNTGGLSALAGVSGINLYGNSTPSNVTDLSSLGLPGQYLAGTCRVLGMGFEVVNTTSKLYKQGQVTTWRQPAPSLDNVGIGSFTPNGGTGATAAGVYLITQPPANLAAAMLLAGSKTWEAADGCYVVAAMNDEVNRAKQPKCIAFLSMTADVQDIDQGTSDVAIGEAISTTTGQFNHPTHIAPFHMCGAYFTGLSLQTTLQLNLVYYVERFPSPSELDLVVLASPSPGFDGMALELYSRTMTHMPTGVPQNMNPLGEWFEGVMHSVAKISEPILKSLSAVVPGAGIGAQIASGVKKATQKAPQNPRNRRKKKQAQATSNQLPQRPRGRKPVVKRIANS